MRARFIMVILLTILVAAQVVVAQDKDRAGTSGATELLIPVGARGIALGGSTIATAKGVDAIYWNPAGLSLQQQSVSVMVSQMSYIADIGIQYLAVGANFGGFGTLGLTIKNIAFGDIINTTEDAIDGVGTYSPAYHILGVTFSKGLTDRIHVGATFNYISETIQRTSASGIALNAGVQYTGLGNIKGLKIGVVVKNLGPDMKFDGSDLYRTATAQNSLRGAQLYKVEAAPFNLPSTLELGLAYETHLGEDNVVTLSGTFQNNNVSVDQYLVGLEYGFKDLLYLRGAYVLAPQITNADDFIYGPSFGVGFHIYTGVDITAEYAYRWVRYFDANQVVTITLGF